jgi:flagellar assembly protein FliH
MSSPVIPKEQLSAYQRWEMASLGGNTPSKELVTPRPNDASAEKSLAILRENARLEGYVAGLAEGRAAGQAEGRAIGQKEGHAEGHALGLAEGRQEAAEELVRLHQIAENFGTAIARADELIAQDILDLTLDLAKAMLKTSLAVRPELIIPIVGEAIRSMPTVQQPAFLILHPDDALLISNHMGDELAKAGWRISEDAHLEHGGCRIETATNHIDASAQTRWQRLAHALGKESDWLAA